MKTKNLIRAVAIVVIAALSLSFFSSCKEKEEKNTTPITFKGVVIGKEFCSANNFGYLIKLERPLNIGGSIDFNGHHENVVKTYSNVILQDDSNIEGTFYIDNRDRVCPAQYEVFSIPEVTIDSIFNSVKF